jgi:hypothetical protein
LKSKADSRVDAPEFRDEKKPAHIVQLENLKTDYERLQARVASERAIRKALKDEPRQLLDEIALTLIRASEASNPVVGQVLDPDRVTRTVDGFPMPGASTSSARRAERKLLSDLHRAVGRIRRLRRCVVVSVSVLVVGSGCRRGTIRGRRTRSVPAVGQGFRVLTPMNR